MKLVTRTNFIHGFHVPIRAMTKVVDTSVANDELFDETLVLDNVESFGVINSTSPSKMVNKSSLLFCCDIIRVDFRY